MEKQQKTWVSKNKQHSETDFCSPKMSVVLVDFRDPWQVKIKHSFPLQCVNVLHSLRNKKTKRWDQRRHLGLLVEGCADYWLKTCIVPLRKSQKKSHTAFTAPPDWVVRHRLGFIEIGVREPMMWIHFTSICVHSLEYLPPVCLSVCSQHPHLNRSTPLCILSKRNHHYWRPISKIRLGDTKTCICSWILRKGQNSP